MFGYACSTIKRNSESEIQLTVCMAEPVCRQPRCPVNVQLLPAGGRRRRESALCNELLHRMHDLSRPMRKRAAVVPAVRYRLWQRSARPAYSFGCCVLRSGESAMLCTQGIVVKCVYGDCVCSSGVDSILKRICHEL